MGKLSDVLEVDDPQNYKLNGSNKIEFHPIFTVQAGRNNSPTEGDNTIQGVAYRTNLWDIGDYVTMKGEIPHEYKDYGYIDFHIRMLPTSDSAGDVSFEVEYFLMHVDGTTSAGGTVTLNGSFAANSLTNNIGFYAEYEAPIPNTFKNGDMIVANVTRVSVASDYPDLVSEIEVGGHCGVGSTGNTLG